MDLVEEVTTKDIALSVTSASTDSFICCLRSYLMVHTVDPSDNNTISNGVVVTVEAQTGGSLLDETAGLHSKVSADTVATATTYANAYDLLSTTALTCS